MYVTARVDYALRATVELATADPDLLTAQRVATSQSISLKLLENILLTLKHAGIVRARRGYDGGYGLARPANKITLADVIRAVEGPLANVRGARPESVAYKGVARPLRDVWIALRVNMRNVLETTTIGDIVADDLPKTVKNLILKPEAWSPH
ncbi:MAG: Rrf2 family transcriptional regulator [Candidatus Eremiobacteraeota bacterium]|nr:Rrf2 family transcriptional regulator [Candidatus Eremiobacteraeota bacterium]